MSEESRKMREISCLPTELYRIIHDGSKPLGNRLQEVAARLSWIRLYAQTWRDDAFEHAAQIAERYAPINRMLVADIRALKTTTPPATPQIGDYWLIFFDDQDVRPEIFTDEAAARARYAKCLDNYTCHLFAQVAARTDVAGDPITETQSHA